MKYAPLGVADFRGCVCRVLLRKHVRSANLTLWVSCGWTSWYGTVPGTYRLMAIFWNVSAPNCQHQLVTLTCSCCWSQHDFTIRGSLLSAYHYVPCMLALACVLAVFVQEKVLCYVGFSRDPGSIACCQSRQKASWRIIPVALVTEPPKVAYPIYNWFIWSFTDHKHDPWGDPQVTMKLSTNQHDTIIAPSFININRC